MKQISYYTLLPVFLLLLTLGCKEKAKEVIKTAPVAFNKEGELAIFAGRTATPRAHLDIEIADNDYETQTGLMYRDAMEARQGMLFVFPGEAMHSFYMKNTKIPLDIIFIDSDNKIASISANTEPFNETGLSSRVPVQYVLEINAGLVGRWGIQVGDSVAYQKN